MPGCGFCKDEKSCGGACGVSIDKEIKLGKKGLKIYNRSKEIVLKRYFEISDSPVLTKKNIDKLFEPRFFKFIDTFTDLKEALEKLRKIREINNKLEKYIKSKNAKQ